MNCPHGMPSAASCVDCMDEGPVLEPAKWHEEGRPFAGRFAGTCRGRDCGERIKDGTAVQRWDRRRGSELLATVYLHRGCVPS